MKNDILKLYRERRRPHFGLFPNGKRHFYQANAAQVLRGVKHELATRAGWSALNGEILESYEADSEPGTVRLIIKPDDFADFDDLCGDCFDPEVNSDIKPEVLNKQREAFADEVNGSGVWGVCSEIWTGSEWVEVDAVWGFVGDDWRGSGYDLDIMQGAIEAFNEVKRAKKADAKKAAQIEAAWPGLMACYI